jgi:signal transduction histidine kinase
VTEPVASAERPPRRHAGVRLRITLLAAGLFAVALTAASFALVRFVHDNLASDIERTNLEQLDQVVAQVRQGAEPTEVSLPSRGPGGQPSLVVLGPDGRPMGAGRHGDRGRPGPPPAERVRDQRIVETATGEQITLIAERSLAEVDSSVDSITNGLVVGVPLLVLLVGLLTWWLAGRALRPVEAIRAEAAEITARTIHRRVPEPDTDDEVGRLARTMNLMLDRLEESSLRQRRFVSDASHELRSPVTTIRAQVEVALRRGDEADWPEVARRVLEEDERLEQAVSELLDLARAEEGEDLEAVEVDIDELVLAETQRDRRVPIDTSRVSAGRVKGNAAQLTRVIRNLLDNASRHATSQVAIEVGVSDDFVRITVDDDGPGVAPGDRARVFDRFTRLDEGRARDAGGMGLGLSLVKAIVERHRGSVSIDESPLGGARFSVRLPLA